MSIDDNSRKTETVVEQAGGGMKRRDLLLSGSSLVAASALSAVGLTSSAQAQQPTPATAGQRPNIVVIMGDDIGMWNLGAYHRGVMAGRTPNLDKLAAEGMLFTDYYAEASCTAGRANFITGELPIRTGMTTVGQAGAPTGIPAQAVTIAQALKGMGYATGQFGKNHLGDKNEFLPTVHGFDEFFGYLYHLDAMEDPAHPGYPQDLLDKAKCVVVIPSVLKAAFLVGGSYGRGAMICRSGKTLSGGWGAPAMMVLEGGSFGFQIGGEETDVVMLLMNKGAQSKLLSGKFTVGLDASVAAGPVGRTTSAQAGGANMTAELLSWSRSRGAFAGVSLQGATLRPDTQANQLLYGKELDNQQIIEGQTPVPPAAQQLLHVLNRYSSRQQ